MKTEVEDRVKTSGDTLKTIEDRISSGSSSSSSDGCGSGSGGGGGGCGGSCTPTNRDIFSSSNYRSSAAEARFVA